MNEREQASRSVQQSGRGEETVKKYIVEQKDEGDAVEEHYSIFCLLLMIGSMIHHRRKGDTYMVLSMCLLLVYLRLSSRRLIETVTLSFFLFNVCTTIKKSPYNANHLNVLGFVSFILVPQQFLRCYYSWRTHKDGKSSKSIHERAGTDRTLNLIRWVIVILYFMAGFHKLNKDFLDPTVSCAYVKLKEYLDIVDITKNEHLENLPLWLEPLPYVGLFMELAPPIFLLSPSTQKYGILMLIKLHWLLLPVGFADFGSIAQSLLWLFVLPATRKSPSSLSWQYYTDMAYLFLLFELVSLVFWYKYGGTYNSHFKNEEAVMVFLAYGIHWMSVIRCNGLSGQKLLRPKSIYSICVLVFFVWFTLNPYFGLRTTGTLTMFSNLRTEGKTSNHLILGSNPFKVFGYQEDVVEVVDLDERIEYFEKGFIYTKLEFDRELIYEKEENAMDNATLEVIYNGEVYKTEDLNNDPRFDIFRTKNEALWESKFLAFREIQKEGPQECWW